MSRARSAAWRATAASCNAAEIDDRPLRSALDSLAARAGFLVEQETVELSGLCPQCRA